MSKLNVSDEKIKAQEHGGADTACSQHTVGNGGQGEGREDKMRMSFNQLIEAAGRDWGSSMREHRKEEATSKEI